MTLSRAACRLAFSVAGLRFCFTSESTEEPLGLPAEYTPFVSEHGSCDAVYTVAGARTAPAPEVAGDWLWQNDLWRVGDTADHGVLIAIRDAWEPEWRSVGCFHGGFKSGTLYPRGVAGSPAARMPFHHPHDRAIILSRLAFIGGGVVHSSCVAADGKAFLFVGSSGAGKTTMARLWRDAGATLLNDERNIIRISPRGPLAGSSPWHGEENQVTPATVPLAGVFYLKQAACNEVRKLTSVESVTRLFTNTLVPVFLQDGPRLILDAWADVLEAVPSYELSFTRDRRAIEACRAAVSTS